MTAGSVREVPPPTTGEQSAVDILSLTDVTSAPSQREIAAFVLENGLKQQSDWYSHVRLSVLLAGWIGLFFVGRWLDQPWAWVMIWAFQAVLFAAFGGAIHEAAHDKLYRRRLPNRVAGWILCVPRLFNFPAYRGYHLAHHRHTHDAERDPEPVIERLGLIDYVFYMLFAGTVYSLIVFYYGALAAIGMGPSWLATKRQRRAAALGTLLFCASITAIVVGCIVDLRLVLELWLIPWVLHAALTFAFVTQSEHFGTDPNPPGSILTTTRTVYSNRVMAFFLWNNNLHTAHHLVPSLPGSALPELQGYIEPYCKYTCRSYTKWHLGMIRSLLPRATRSARTLGFWSMYAAEVFTKASGSRSDAAT